MKPGAFLTLLLLSLPAAGSSGEPESGPVGTAMGGLDAGYAPGFKEFGGLSFALNAGYLERRGIYLGGQIGLSREVLLPPFWDGKPEPTETRFEANVLLGRVFMANRAYLKAAGGIGFLREVRRGEEIDDYPGGRHEKEVELGLGFPLELSFGYLNELGAGLKVRGLVGRDMGVGILAEFLGWSGRPSPPR